MIRRRIKNRIKKILGRPAEESKPSRAAEPAPAPRAEAKPAAKPTPAAKPAEPKPEPVATPAPEPVAAKAEPAPAAAPAVEETPQGDQAPTEKATVADSDDTAGAPLSMEAVQEILDDMVRPALQADGGDITLLKVENNDIFVKLVGSCSTCPSSIMTMKMGVERLLMEEFPAMGQLVQVD